MKRNLEVCYYDFHAFMRKPVLQACAEQLISSIEFEIGQNNQYEI